MTLAGSAGPGRRRPVQGEADARTRAVTAAVGSGGSTTSSRHDGKLSENEVRLKPMQSPLPARVAT